ncbi:hypothetical protein H0H93_005268 [Arthromyces matolae]|nr:hypothetical protein H0H93_005268 [Arthromyces matolae]
MEARWRFDNDDNPASGPDGSDEQNRVLVDDYSPRLLSQMMTFMSDLDQHNLITDPSIPVMIDGAQRFVLPYRLGMNPNQIRRPQRPPPITTKGTPQPVVKAAAAPPVNGTPIAMPQQMKMPPPLGVPAMRIPNGLMRPPSAVPQAVPGTPLVPQSPTPPSTVATLMAHGVPANGFGRAAMTMPHVALAMNAIPTATPTNDVAMPVPVSQPLINGAAQCPGDSTQSNELKATPQASPPSNAVTPVNPNATGILQPQTHLGMVTPNGYHLNPLTQALANGAQYYPSGITGLSPQQVRDIKTTFANMGAAPTYLQVQVPGPGPKSSVFSS